MWALAALFPASIKKGLYQKPFSILIVAHNEAANLKRKIPNILGLQNASQIEEIIIASDGSTDDTFNVVRSFGDKRIKLIEFANRRGKPSVLNDVIPQCKSEVIFLMDARQTIGHKTLSQMLENFVDCRVGVVSCDLMFHESKGAKVSTQGIDKYWKYEKSIRRNESRYKSVPGATGACYAIRKELFRSIPDNVLLDDVAIPMQIICSGHQSVFENQAYVYDYPAFSIQHESVRKRRTIAGNFQLVNLYPSWLVPASNPIWLSYFSHKILRLLSPFLLMMFFISNVVLVMFDRTLPLLQIMWLSFLVGQLCFIGAASFGVILKRSCIRNIFVSVPLMFITLNFVIILAFLDALRGKYTVNWARVKY